MRTIDQRVILFTIIWIIFAVAVGVGVRYYQQQARPQTVAGMQDISLGANGSTAELADSQVLQRISKHMVLPATTPEIVTLTDVETLKREQPFFTGAQEGFKLLVYPEKVILYDPVRDLIVDFAHIRPDEE